LLAPTVKLWATTPVQAARLLDGGSSPSFSAISTTEIMTSYGQDYRGSDAEK